MDDIGEPEATVVIHPGSYWLRIGKAIDPLPESIPHVIARRNKHLTKPKCERKILSRDGISDESRDRMKQSLQEVTSAIGSRMTSSGKPREAVDMKKILAYNDASLPDTLDESSGLHWTNTSEEKEFYFGEQALYLHPKENYNIHWPFRHGGLNLHPGLGGSITSVLQDLETVWVAAIEKYLRIPRQDLSEYNAILLIPDIYHRPHIKELMNLLLLRMGFGAALIHQESVCATYGSGLCSACVVDVGDQKTAVTCVEDGLSHRNTRVCMAYGGSDITRTFTWLMEHAHFPYRTCQMDKTMDALLLMELKETFCHLDQDFDGTQQLGFHVSMPTCPTLMYKMHLGDETMIAPMGLFYPQLFGVMGQKMTFTQQRNQGDPEDIHDELYLLQTQQQQQIAKLKPGLNSTDPASNNDVTLSSANQRSESPSIQSQTDNYEAAEEAPQSLVSRRISSAQNNDGPLPLDQAIVYSIDSCASEETKRKMYSCILVVGGGMSLFQGAADTLQHRILSKMPAVHKKAVEKVDVICKSKELDPRLTCWKGGSVLACLDTTQELWIHQLEWKKHGLKVLRERAPFVW